jgi:proline iminopeptidase
MPVRRLLNYSFMGMKNTWKLSVLIAFMTVAGCAVGQNRYTVKSKDGAVIHVQEYGNGKPVILLAGGPGLNAQYLQPVWERMTEYRFIVPDQRGTGRSSTVTIDSVSLQVANYVEDVEALRKRLKVAKITIAGHSWGGMLAMAYAAKYPTQVEKIVLLSSGGATAQFFAYFEANILMRLHPADLQEKAAAKDDGVRSTRAIYPGYFFHREKALTYRSGIDSVLVSRASGPIFGYTIGNYAKTSVARVQALRAFKNPVYIIQGRQDPIGESTVFENKSYLPQAQINFIEMCGHFPWLEGDDAQAKFFTLLGDALK